MGVFVVFVLSQTETITPIYTKDSQRYDSSFNSNRVSIATADFRFILDNFLLNDDKKSILTDAKASLSEKSTLPQTFSEALKNMGAKLCESFADKVIGKDATDAAFTLADYIKGVVIDYYQEAKN